MLLLHITQNKGFALRSHPNFCSAKAYLCWEIDKNIELKKIEIKEQEQLYIKEKKELAEKIQSRGSFNSGLKEEKEK